PFLNTFNLSVSEILEPVKTNLNVFNKSEWTSGSRAAAYFFRSTTHSQCESGSRAEEVGRRARTARPFTYFFRSTTHSQCESPWSIFLVSLKVKFGFKLSVAP